MIDELKLLGELAQQVSIAQASLRQKEALLKKLLDEIPLESRAFNALLVQHGLLKQKLAQPVQTTQPTYYDNAVQVGQMGDRNAR